MDQDLRSNAISFSEHCVHRVPLAAIGRKYREAVLDKVLDITERGTGKHKSAELANHLSLMLKLMEVPNATARLCVDPTALESVAAALSNEDVAEEPTLVDLLRALVQQTLKHLTVTREQERSQKYLDGLRDRLLYYIDGIGFPAGQPGIAVVLTEAFPLLIGNNVQSLGEDLTVKYLAVLGTGLVEADLMSRDRKPFVRQYLDALLTAIVQLPSALADPGGRCISVYLMKPRLTVYRCF